MPSIINATTTTGLVSSADNSGELRLQTNSGNTAMTINTSQNMGVGTTSPTARLHVYGGSNNQLKVESSGAEANFTLAGTSYGQINNSVGDWYLTNDTSANMIFRTASTERMRITSGGAVLVNETSTSFAPLMQLTGSAGTYNLFVVKQTQTSYGTGVRLITFLNSADAIAGVISHSGVTSVTYGTSSDERLKENIVDAPNALDKVMDIKVRSYDWKEDSSHVEYGLVAQEVNQVYGEPIGVGGEDVKSEPWNIEYGRLTPILLKAVQELKTQLDEVKAELDATKAEVAALKGA